MKFKSGDAVEVMDDQITGHVLRYEDEMVVVENEDGFEFRFRESELVHHWQASPHELRVTQEALSQKEIPSKPGPTVKRPKDRLPPPMIVDLHIEKLSKNHRRLDAQDILILQSDTARSQLEWAIRKRLPRLILIHGVGEGVLKDEVTRIARQYPGVRYRPADAREFGAGALEVLITQSASLR